MAKEEDKAKPTGWTCRTKFFFPEVFRIRRFWGFPGPDPVPDPSINKQKS
jgi:hypothetical protein